MSIREFQELLNSFPQPGDPIGYRGTWREAAVERGLLPVYSDWECCYALTREGEPVYSADTTWAEQLPLTNSRHRFVVLAQAAERYASLASLRPQRRPGDPSCPTCHGTGKTAYPNLMCECGGLGWFPADSELGPS